MNCPHCRSDSRVLAKEGNDRRRQCIACKHRFTTVELLKSDHLRLQGIVEGAQQLAEQIKDAA